MKRLLTILCSLLVALAFTNVTLAVDSNIKKKDPPFTKQGNWVPKDIKNTDTQQKEEKKETKDAKKGKKIEKKEEQKKADEKK
jgi:hypothetical protein